MKAPTMQQEEVLCWLAENQPDLFKAAEIDRSWVWLPVDLRGCKVGGSKCDCQMCREMRATRTAIKFIGFRYAKNGHELPSGSVGTWAHHCDRPIPFRRKHGGKGNESGERTPKQDLDAEILAALSL